MECFTTSQIMIMTFGAVTFALIKYENRPNQDTQELESFVSKLEERLEALEKKFSKEDKKPHGQGA